MRRADIEFVSPGVKGVHFLIKDQSRLMNRGRGAGARLGVIHELQRVAARGPLRHGHQGAARVAGVMKW